MYIRLICAKCGCCAGHDEDRVDGKCHHCGSVQTTVQVRIKNVWFNVPPSTSGLDRIKSRCVKGQEIVIE